jgi:hypothetical protein
LVIIGSNRENVIRAERQMCAAAWRAAVDHVSALGMLGGITSGDPQVG